MKRLLILLFCVAGIASAETDGGYLMGYFTESPQKMADSRELHLAVSKDALNWMPLNQNRSVYVPVLGERGLRDPFFLRKSDGSFVVLATNLRDDLMRPFQTIHVWTTKDFINFENPRLLKMHDDPHMRTWAPEAFWDPEKKKYAILWSGNTDYFRTYVNYTDDFMSVGSHQLYFDPGFNQIDATIYSGPEGNFLYFKDWTISRLRGARASSLAPGSFNAGVYTKPISNEVIVSMEAPLLLKVTGQNRWFLYGDSYRPVNSEFYVWKSDDITKDSWDPVDYADYNMPMSCKHGNIIPITQAEMDKLVDFWGKPEWNRIKSFNNPDQIIRHAGYRGRLSPYPFDPYADSMWKIRPGPAGNDSIAFESANLPGHFLFDKEGELVLGVDDGTIEFKNAASFIKVSGLADGSHNSFRAIGFPHRYIRHKHGNLRIEEIDSTADKQDSTFIMVY
jgi:hypothetical protein